MYLIEYKRKNNINEIENRHLTSQINYRKI